MTRYTDKVLIEKRDFATFEDDMIRHTKLDVFQKNDYYFIGDGTMMVVQFSNHSKLPTLKELIANQYFSKSQFNLFLNHLIGLKRLCDEYLLEFDKIDFNAETALVDSESKAFVWRYIPTQNAHSSATLCNLLRQIIIESDALKDLFSLSALKEEVLLPEQIIDTLEQKDKSSKPFFFKTVFSKKKFSSEITTETHSKKTIHSCQYPMIINKSNPSECYKLYFNHNTIGREVENNIHIDDHSISRHHAVIFKEDFNYYIKDLDSTNGTWFSGQKIDEAKKVDSGDAFQLGNKEFIFIR